MSSNLNPVIKPETKTITLDYPFEVNGVITDTLTLRRPTLGDWLNSRHGQHDEQAIQAKMLSDLCSMSPEDIRSIDMSDYVKLDEWLGKILSPKKNSER